MSKEVIFSFGRCFELESMSFFFLFYLMHIYILSLFHYSLFYCTHFILFVTSSYIMINNYLNAFPRIH